MLRDLTSAEWEQVAGWLRRNAMPDEMPDDLAASCHHRCVVFAGDRCPVRLSGHLCGELRRMAANAIRRSIIDPEPEYLGSQMVLWI
ncbi:MAG: hypothetical protein AAF663_01770 [Planctomycetota bacterium]